jgi:hypothetical protein
LHELVPPAVYRERGQRAWQLLQTTALLALDNLRDRYGPITVNNWYWHGPREWSGLRTPESPYYSPYSQHTFGRAFDCIFDGVTAEEVRRDILNNPSDYAFVSITAIELGTSWLHFDTRNVQRIYTFSAR